MATISLQIAAVKAPSMGKDVLTKPWKHRRITCNSVTESGSDSIPDSGKRKFVSSMLLMGAMAPATASSYWNAAWAEPEGEVAQDEYGKDIVAAAWTSSHAPGDHTLVRGSSDGPIYLVMETDGSLASYGINAICTHMGCVVPWNPQENKFMCPCHGSQYDFQGKVVQGPAPLSLALAHVDVVNEKVIFSPWFQTDFRTDEAPWWAED